jgi:ribosomal protein S18 acetylase RimI-like enzyme
MRISGQWRAGAPRAFLVVRRSNEAAQRLASLGFTVTGVRKNYHSERRRRPHPSETNAGQREGPAGPLEGRGIGNSRRMNIQ